ncbi:MAG: hypothetical protein ABIH83_05565 [Candidatus Micrarchaeota archaeon]
MKPDPKIQMLMKRQRTAAATKLVLSTSQGIREAHKDLVHFASYTCNDVAKDENNLKEMHNERGILLSGYKDILERDRRSDDEIGALADKANIYYISALIKDFEGKGREAFWHLKKAVEKTGEYRARYNEEYGNMANVALNSEPKTKIEAEIGFIRDYASASIHVYGQIWQIMQEIENVCTVLRQAEGIESARMVLYFGVQLPLLYSELKEEEERQDMALCLQILKNIAKNPAIGEMFASAMNKEFTRQSVLN